MQLTLKIFGQVQGVWYRASTMGVARDLGLTGYAKNEEAGEVTVIAVGPKENLGKLKKWCQRGPQGAVVERIEEEWTEEGEDYQDFSVL